MRISSLEPRAPTDASGPESHAELDLGTGCNNRCVFCERSSPCAPVRGPAGARSLAELQASSSVRMVGGEPTLAPELCAAIRAARTMGIERVALVTNGRRLAVPGFARTLAEAGATDIEVMLAGPRRDIHDALTRAPRAFGQAITGMSAARAAGLRLAVRFVATRSSYRHLHECVDLAASLGALELVVQLAGAPPRGAGRIAPRKELVGLELVRAAEAARRRRIPLAVIGLPRCLVEPPTVAWLPLPRSGEQGEACVGCAARLDCTGLDADYASRYGFAELRPLGAPGHAGAAGCAGGWCGQAVHPSAAPDLP